MEVLSVWKAADEAINTSLAIHLGTLAFAAATFLTGWVKSKEQDLISQSANKDSSEKARQRLECAKRAIDDLLLAFVAFSFLLIQAIFVDPLAIVGAEWGSSVIVDSITASGGLATGMVFFVKAAWNIHHSITRGQGS